MKYDLTLVTLSQEQIANAKKANGTRKRITHALVCGPYGQILGTEAQCLKYWEAWNPERKTEVSKGKFRAIFPDLFGQAVKTNDFPVSNFETTFVLVNELIAIQDRSTS